MSMSDADFAAICDQDGDCMAESSAKDGTVIMPPTDPGTSSLNLDIAAERRAWARRDGRGKATESSGGFVLPNGTRYAPDAAWISLDRLRRLGPQCPEFVIELVSPRDPLKRQRLKMAEWIDNGAEFGWLIHPANREVTIYRPGQPPELLGNPDRMEGEGPVAGFILEMGTLWPDNAAN